MANYAPTATATHVLNDGGHDVDVVVVGKRRRRARLSLRVVVVVVERVLITTASVH